MKQNVSNFKSFIIIFLRLLGVFLTQVFVENFASNFFDDDFIRISVSFIFIINILIFIYYRNLKLYFFLQLIIILAITIVKLSHSYFFNVFSFYARTNYILYHPFQFIEYIIVALFAAVCLYFVSLYQFKQLTNILYKKYIIVVFIMILFFFKIQFNSFNLFYFDKQILITAVNQNLLPLYIEDYKIYNRGKDEITNYKCLGVNDISPTIKFMYNNNDKKELLLIIESWGVLKTPINQNQYISYIKKFFLENQQLSKRFKLIYGETCFQGNTSAAEGRELLNMNDEESYQAFLFKDVDPKYNVVEYKNAHGYHTISGVPASKNYGSSWSNIEGFRRKIGFKSRFYYEDLIIKNKINKENFYISVNDEAMIDSLFNFSKIHQKLFAYGLTINTHSPFTLDKNNINSIKYKRFYSTFSKIFDEKSNAIDHSFRISSIISHIFSKINLETSSFDKILIVGDHAPPVPGLKKLYNSEKVPYLLISKK